MGTEKDSRAKKKTFVCFIDDNDEETSGWFDNVIKKDGYLEIQSERNRISIPNHRVKKVKEQLD